ncbi:MAG: AraC family transcriptional regulator [Mangrovicoccus sp.]|nr:AraC family transcriptional regulator [Mangrovicoccus sp.]
MQDPNQPRSPASIRILCEAAPDYGVQPGQCLEGMGVKLFELYAAGTTVTISDEVRAIENFLRYAPKRSGLGVEIGRRYRPEVFGIWGYAILSSPTLRAGIQTAIDYANLSFVIARLGIDESQSPPLVSFDTSGLSSAAKGFILERHITVLTNFREQILPMLAVSQYYFKTTITDPEFEKAIKEMLGIKVALGCDVDGFVMREELLDMPLPTSDPKALEYCLDQCRATLRSEAQSQTPWAEKVRDAYLAQVGTPPSIAQVAAGLHVSERTLRRRLAQEGTSFRDLYTEARLSIAYELLKTTGLTVAAVAWRTGYSEPSSFVRAFSRRYGHPPGKIKRQGQVA